MSNWALTEAEAQDGGRAGVAVDSAGVRSAKYSDQDLGLSSGEGDRSRARARCRRSPAAGAVPGGERSWESRRGWSTPCKARCELHSLRWY